MSSLRETVVCRIVCSIVWATALAAVAGAQPWRPVQGEIRGVVRTADGQPIDGAEVALSGPQSAQASTTPSGSFAFSGLAPGSYTVEVGARGRVSSWAEEIEVASAASPFLVFELAEGKETAVTVTFAPVLDGAPTGPVWRLTETASWALPSGGSALRLAGLLTLGPDPTAVLLDGGAPRLGGLLLETFPAEWLAGLSAPASTTSAAVAGTSVGEELVLETKTANDVWTGGAWLSHQSRSFEGRDRRQPEVGDDGQVVGVKLDRDRTAERFALSGTGRLGAGWSLGLAQLFGQRAASEQLDACTLCAPNPRVGSESETDLLSGALRHEGRLGLLARWTEAEETRTASTSASVQTAAGRGLLEEEQRGARLTLPGGRRTLLGLTLGDRRSSRALAGYFPGRSGIVVAAGEGGAPRRGAGSEEPISPGEELARSEDEALTLRWELLLGAHELRLGGGRSRSHVSDFSERLYTGLHWNVPPAIGVAPQGHALVVGESRSAALRLQDDSAWAEWRLRSARAAVLGGLRWQGGQLRQVAGPRTAELTTAELTTDAASSWLPRLAVAFDPRGMGQERLLFSVARVAAETESLVPWVFAAATESSVLGESLNESLHLFEGASPTVRVPARLSLERSTLWLGSAEHLLLPGLVVGATARYRVIDRGLRSRELAPGLWQLDDSNTGTRSVEGDGPCARGIASARLWATWRGERSELLLAADSWTRHGLRSADCLAARPAAVRHLGGDGRAEEQRIEILGSRRFGERWSLGTSLFWKTGRVTTLGTLDVIEQCDWLVLPQPLAAASRSAWRADVALHYRLPVADDGGLVLTAEVLNLFDGRGALGEQQTLSLSPDVDGAAGARDPRAGQAVSVQEPRAVRLRLGWRW